MDWSGLWWVGLGSGGFYRVGLGYDWNAYQTKLDGSYLLAHIRALLATSPPTLIDCLGDYKKILHQCETRIVFFFTHVYILVIYIEC